MKLLHSFPQCPTCRQYHPGEPCEQPVYDGLLTKEYEQLLRERKEGDEQNKGTSGAKEEDAR